MLYSNTHRNIIPRITPFARLAEVGHGGDGTSDEGHGGGQTAGTAAGDLGGGRRGGLGRGGRGGLWSVKLANRDQAEEP